MQSKFGKKILINSLLIITLGAGFGSCAPGSADSPNFEEVLPDDPSTEQADLTPEEIADAEQAVMQAGLTSPNYSAQEQGQILSGYNYFDPGNEIPDSLLAKAVSYYHANKSRIGNNRYLSIIDFGKHSSKKRFWIINTATGAVQSYHVAHGSGSDRNNDGYADSFSNTPNSNATSLGIYKTGETYSGKWGFSLRLDGLSGTNSKARARAIVIHGASYVRDANVQQGRSWGCPAVPLAYREKVINLIKGGSILYAGTTR